MQLTASQLSHVDMSAALDGLSQYYSNYLPSNARIGEFSMCSSICTLAEFVDCFESPIDVTLPSTDVWPVQPVVDYLQVEAES